MASNNNSTNIGENANRRSGRQTGGNTQASSSSEATGSAQSASGSNTKSSDLKYGPQRIYSKTNKGIAVAEEKLKNTAYTILSDAQKTTIMAAIKNELKENIRKDHEEMPPRTILDYDVLVDGVISKVFDDNIDLFKTSEDDNPDVKELLNFTG